MPNEEDAESLYPNTQDEFHISRPILTNDLFNRIAQRAPPNQRSFASISRTLVRKFKQTSGLNSILPDKSSQDDLRGFQCNARSSVQVLCNILISIFPFINMLRKYEPRKWLVSDIVAGLTVGIMHVPQGMAYAMLATLPPVYGLYTSFFPPLVYFFFGTSGHISIGTIAVVSLLTGDFLDKVVKDKLANVANLPDQFLKFDNNSTTGMANVTVDPTAIRVFYAPALTLTVGLTQVLMGVLRLGGLTRYFSTPMTSGFTVGVAVHVFSSQIKNVLGINIRRPAGLFTLPLTYVEIFKNIQNSNIPTVVLSSICITILAVYKDWINPRIVKYTMVPLPMDLIIVVLCTVVSHFLHLNEKYYVKIVGQVNKGIEPPELPHLAEMSNFIGDIVVVAIVAFSVSISLSQIFASRFNYRINTNQELIAYGLANTFSSFFHTFPTAASLSRSAVQVSAGGQTQVATLFSSGLLIMVLCFIGPLFYSVPNCCLASIILVALKGMFMQAIDMKYLWKYSLWDSSVWLVTVVSTIFLNVSYGLLVGIAYSALCTILRTQSPHARVLGQSDNMEIYTDPKRYNNCSEHANIKIVCYEGNLYYACGEHFRESIYSKSGVNPSDLNLKRTKVMRKLEKIENRLKICVTNQPLKELHTGGGLEITVEDYQETKSSMNSQPSGADGSKRTVNDSTSCINLDLSDFKPKCNHDRCSCSPKPYGLCRCKQLPTEKELKHKLVGYFERLDKLNQLQTLRYLILDCSYWTFMDFTGADELKQLVQDYHKVGISVMLACLKDELVDILKANNKLDHVELYLTVHDAVLAATRKLKENPDPPATNPYLELNGCSLSAEPLTNVTHPGDNSNMNQVDKWPCRSSSISDCESRI